MIRKTEAAWWCPECDFASPHQNFGVNVVTCQNCGYELPDDDKPQEVTPETEEVVENVEPEPEPDPTPTDWSEYTVPELEAFASEAGLEVEGTGANGHVVKDDLVTALTAHESSDE